MCSAAETIYFLFRIEFVKINNFIPDIYRNQENTTIRSPILIDRYIKMSELYNKVRVLTPLKKQQTKKQTNKQNKTKQHTKQKQQTTNEQNTKTNKQK